MATTTAPLTIEDFERLPEDEVKHRELVDGVLVDVSGTTLVHKEIQRILVEFFRLWISTHGGYAIFEQEYDFLGNVHGPDVTFIRPERLHLREKRKRVQRFAPDVAVEIVSPNDTATRLVQKKDRYLRAGTSEVWIIYEEPAEVYNYAANSVRLLHPGDTITTPICPGLEIPVNDLFRDF